LANIQADFNEAEAVLGNNFRAKLACCKYDPQDK
jgi:hypothetical protein